MHNTLGHRGNFSLKLREPIQWRIPSSNFNITMLAKVLPTYYNTIWSSFNYTEFFYFRVYGHDLNKISYSDFFWNCVD